jgi:dipeptidyl aminopeptidase/acylaminoacyl peptidase
LTLFHGEQDTNAPLAMVRRAVAELPGARLVTYPGEAHLSTLCNHMDDVARALTGKPAAIGGHAESTATDVR